MLNSGFFCRSPFSGQPFGPMVAIAVSMKYFSNTQERWRSKVVASVMDDFRCSNLKAITTGRGDMAYMAGRAMQSKGSTRARLRNRRRYEVVAGFGLLLLLCLGAGSATAEDPASSPQTPANYLPGWAMRAGLEAGAAEADPAILAGPITDPAAAEQLPHSDLDRGEAAELLTSVFGEVLEAPADAFGDLQVERYHSDHIALVGPRDVETDEPGLLTSLLPLRDENAFGQRMPVDLELERSAGDLQPQNPLAEVEIPAVLGEGVSLSDAGVKVELAGAPSERAVSNLESTTAFYPNVAPDSDLIALPTPTGVETSTILRSPDAPRAQTFELSMPPGARLQASEDGGAVILQDGKTIVVVKPPTAIDAEGDSVTVNLEVSGSSLVLQTTPGEGDKFPILVDPIYETYFWNQYPNDYSPEWYMADTGYPFVAGWAGGGGLGLYSYLGAITPGSQAMANYYVPRFFSDFNDPAVKARPTSYIKEMTMSQLSFLISENQPYYNHPYVQMGLWSESKGQWVSLGMRFGSEGQLTDPNYVYRFTNPNEVTDAKNGGISLASFETQSHNRYVGVRQATVEISDKDSPGFGQIQNPSGWMHEQVSGQVGYTASDPGLGIYAMRLKQPKATGGSELRTTSAECLGSARKPCLRTLKSSERALSFDPKAMPQGENFVSVIAADPIGHETTGTAKLKIDHAAPNVSLSGTLTEQATLGTKLTEYILKYSATDGEDTAASSLTPFGTPGTGSGQMQRPMGVAVDAVGNIWVVDRENNRVLKFDKDGNFLSQFGSTGSSTGQFSDPRGIAVSPNGNIWVTDLGNRRVQGFNSNGEFIRAISFQTGAQPYAVAAGPGGALWVTDIGLHRVVRLLEDGSVLGVATGKQNAPSDSATDLSSPVGIAFDAFGNAWVADNGIDRIIEFDSSGKFVSQFGSTGTGAGQLRGPIGIDIAPSGNILVVDSANNRVEEFKPDGAYLRQFGTTGSGSNQLSEPRGISFGPGNTAVIADAGNRRIARWKSVDEDPQSGVAKTEVKVDGSLVEPAYAPGCATKNCAISREWTLDASDYSSGHHRVEITATDGVGLSTTKELTVTTDDTPPQLTANSKFFTAPKGWLEQKNYFYSASASDVGGYGVTSITLKIDGEVASSMTQTCTSGGCSGNLFGLAQMATYKGGSHPAELIATDAAGNTAKKAWTIHVDPKGEISLAEASDTLEAVEATSSANLIGDSAEEELPGTAPDLGVGSTSEGFTTIGTEVPAEISGECSSGITMKVLDEDLIEGKDPPNGEDPPLSTIEFAPVGTNAANASEEVASNATVCTDTADHIDTIVRPLYDGAMTFQGIRDPGGAEAFSWEVYLDPGQELKAIDDTRAAVYFEDGYLALTISAVPAHDAVGTTVPTKLTVSEGNVITLRVEHRAASFVYPVVGGAGWEGGFTTHSVVMPPPESNPEEKGIETFSVVSAPEPAGHGDPGDATASKIPTYIRKYGYYACASILGGGCPAWKHKIKGFFFFNGRYAWWKDRHPVCEHDQVFAVTVTEKYCDWIGPNHQPYGSGYHITSQTRFDVTESVKAINQTDSYALTIRMFGSGTWKGHPNDRVCNPSRSECA